ncbi:MAG TPA: hypothetical protein VJP76_06030 [Candidatus Tumulicola sp.]|nr:hypothetical protein [Candidatus Tumulicola sp.]
MKRAAFAAIALAAALLPPGALRAQIPPPPTPSPDPHTYSDPAMNFTAPAGALLVGRRIVPVEQLGQDLEPVAIWVLHPGKEDMRTITIAMESFTGAPDQWEGQFESQMHNSGDGVLIRGKTAMSLLNGMPANFVEVTSGSGFTSRKQFAVVWADGQRGIALSVTCRLGDVSAEEAKGLLKNATAVRYPVDQP